MSYLSGNGHAVAQCKPIALKTLTEILAMPPEFIPGKINGMGFKQAPDIRTAEGLNKTFNACFVTFKDGYARYTQSIVYLADLELISVVLLDKDNYTAILKDLLVSCKYKGKDESGYDMYEDKKFSYTTGIETGYDPLQKVHPSYVLVIGFK